MLPLAEGHVTSLDRHNINVRTGRNILGLSCLLKLDKVMYDTLL